jgi:hypothetical protein
VKRYQASVGYSIPIKCGLCGGHIVTQRNLSKEGSLECRCVDDICEQSRKWFNASGIESLAKSGFICMMGEIKWDLKGQPI